MAVFSKFIVEKLFKLGDCLIIAKCTHHKQLCFDNTKVKGGGWWTLDRENLVFTLFGDSHDFGMADIKDIANCVQNKKVFSSPTLNRNFTDTFTFLYRNENDEIFDLQTYKTK